MISDNSARAYRAVLAAALYHLRMDLAAVFGGITWWRPLALRSQLQAVRTAANRAIAFHNLAIYSARDFDGFKEDYFWQEIDRFHATCPKPRYRYRDLFEFARNGNKVDILAISFGPDFVEPRIS